MANTFSTDTPYQELVNRLINGKTGTIKIQEKLLAMLEVLLSESEAQIAAKLPGDWVSLEDISSLVDSELPNLKDNLDSMCAKGFILDQHSSGSIHYRLRSNLFNFLKFSLPLNLEGVDKEALLNNFRECLSDGSLGQDLFGFSTPRYQIIPKEKAINGDEQEQLSHEIVTNIINSADRLAIEECNCTQIGSEQKKPSCHSDNNFSIHLDEFAEYRMRWGQAQELSKDEALEKITEAQKKEFVHLVDKIENNVGAICSCDPKNCLYLMNLKRSGVATALIASPFQVVLHEDDCSGCATCEAACPMFAITMENNASWELKPDVQENECIGCGICVIGCPGEALTLTRREV